MKTIRHRISAAEVHIIKRFSKVFSQDEVSSGIVRGFPSSRPHVMPRHRKK